MHTVPMLRWLVVGSCKGTWLVDTDGAVLRPMLIVVKGDEVGMVIGVVLGTLLGPWLSVMLGIMLGTNCIP